MLVEYRSLAHYDPNLPLRLTVDASNRGVLSQRQNDVDLPIAFTSRTTACTTSRRLWLLLNNLTPAFIKKGWLSLKRSRNSTCSSRKVLNPCEIPQTVASYFLEPKQEFQLVLLTGLASTLGSFLVKL